MTYTKEQETRALDKLLNDIEQHPADGWAAARQAEANKAPQYRIPAEEQRRIEWDAANTMDRFE